MSSQFREQVKWELDSQEDYRRGDLILTSWQLDLETQLTEFVNALSISRRANWLAGDIIVKALDGYPEEEAKIIGWFAEHADCSKERIRQMARVSRAFSEEVRAQDKKWSFHLVVYGRAQALGMKPLELLNLALEHGWSNREVAQYGKAQVPIEINDPCSTCAIKRELEELKKK